MKKFNLAAVSIFLFAVLSFAPSASADSFLMQFTGVGGANSGGVYTYPYTFTVTDTNTSATLNLNLMCISFNNDVNFGESWTAVGYTAGYLALNAGANTTLGNMLSASGVDNPADFETAAYLYYLASTSLDPSVVSEVQWAAWYLFDPTMQDNYGTAPYSTTELASFIGNVPTNLSAYSNYEFFIAVPGTETGNSGTPQSFAGPILYSGFHHPDFQGGPLVTPEPSTLLLLGTGIMILAFFLYRKARIVTKISCQ